MNIGDKARLKEDEFLLFSSPIPAGAICEILNFDEEGVIIKFEKYSTGSNYEEDYGAGAYWLFKKDIEVIEEQNHQLTIEEVFEALEDGKRVICIAPNADFDEVYLEDDRLYWDEDCIEDDVVYMHKDLLKPGAFEILEEPVEEEKEEEYVYYRLRNGEFDEIPKTSYEIAVVKCELQETPFNNFGNDEILELYHTEFGDIEIFKRVKKEG